jgi:hypothetical protein
MRLLSKTEVDKLKQDDKSREISEGLKISRRVDALRELSAKEEQNLTKFRDEILSNLRKEEEEIAVRKSDLAKEVAELDKKLANLLPDIATDRKSLDKQKKELNLREKYLNEKQESINLQEIDIAEVLKSATDSEIQAKTREEQAEILHDRASEDRFLAQQALSEAKKKEERILKQENDLNERFSLREKGIVEKEKRLKLLAEENLAIRKEMDEEKVRLNDQRATLERALTRLRTNRLG